MKKIGIAFAGGGGRGAYQLGVWKAFRDIGWDNKVAAVSGTSVGALNAALFLQGDFEKAEKAWDQISFKKLVPFRWNNRYEELSYKRETGKIYLAKREGLIDIINEFLDISVFDRSPIDCYITCLRCNKNQKEKSLQQIEYLDVRMNPTRKSFSNGRIEYFNMREYSEEERLKILLASSAIPILFPTESINGNFYFDGGAGNEENSDNLPIRPLYEKEKCDFIFTMPLMHNQKPVDTSEYKNARIIEIRPHNNIGGMLSTLDFSAENARNRMIEGYNDTKRTLEEANEIVKELGDMVMLNKEFLINESTFLYESRKMDGVIHKQIEDIRRNMEV